MRVVFYESKEDGAEREKIEMEGQRCGETGICMHTSIHIDKKD